MSYQRTIASTTAWLPEAEAALYRQYNARCDELEQGPHEVFQAHEAEYDRKAARCLELEEQAFNNRMAGRVPTETETAERELQQITKAAA